MGGDRTLCGSALPRRIGLGAALVPAAPAALLEGIWRRGVRGSVLEKAGSTGGCLRNVGRGRRSGRADCICGTVSLHVPMPAMAGDAES